MEQVEHEARGEPSRLRSTAGSRSAPGSGLARALAWIALATTGVVMACAAKGPPAQLKPAGKYQWAKAHFAAGAYGSAAKGFKAFLLASPLDPRTDSAQYLLGESYYRDGQYEQAADAFDRLGTNRPSSPLADDALLGVCASYWKLSPGLALDQDYTRKAENACNRLVQYYPNSPLSDSAKALQARARDKLAAKAYRIGKWYYDHGVYESANVYFQVVLKSYPKAPIVPDVLASLYHSYRKIGFDSEAKDVRHRLLTEYADSRAAHELRDETGQGAD